METGTNNRPNKRGNNFKRFDVFVIIFLCISSDDFLDCSCWSEQGSSINL